MTRLNQIIAIEKGVKADTLRDVTNYHRTLGKPALLMGIARTYQPKDDDGDQLPPESTKVQVNAADVLHEVGGRLSRLFDVVATKDLTNTYAKADVIVDGVAVVRDVPATTLLFLEKQLADLHTIIRSLPLLDPAEDWEFDTNRDCWATEPARTTRSKKVPRNHVRAEATQHHPAQVEVFTEDVIVGTWTTVKLSGAMPAKRVAELIRRVDALRDAVKQAREAANTVEVTDKKIGEDIFAYLLD